MLGIPATKPGAGEGGEVQNDTSTNDRTWLRSDLGRMRVEVENFSRLFPHSRSIFEEHAEANGPTVPLIGVIERLLGIVRRATHGCRQAKRGSRGSSSGGPVARLFLRLR